jgi:hypothetical protein
VSFLLALSVVYLPLIAVWLLLGRLVVHRLGWVMGGIVCLTLLPMAMTPLAFLLHLLRSIVFAPVLSHLTGTRVF